MSDRGLLSRRVTVVVLLFCVVVVTGSVAGGAATAQKKKLAPGVILDVYDLGKSVQRIPPLMPDQRPNVSKRIDTVELNAQQTEIQNHFLAKIHGVLLVRKGGTYRFQLTSDDGSRLTIGDKRVVNHDGHHGATAKNGQIRLKAGRHPFSIEWFDAGGAESLKFEWAPPGKRFELVPAQVLASVADYDHATTGGTKKILVDRKLIDHLTKQEAISGAIEDGIDWLLAEVEKRQVDGSHGAGQVALETYALLVAGVSVDHPAIEKNFSYMKREVISKKNTYWLACYIFALDAAISQLEYDYLILSPPKDQAKILDNPAIGKKYRGSLTKAVETLLASQRPDGGFRYYPKDKTTDNSCTQFAALAMGIGAKRNVRVPFEAWAQMGQYFLDNQMKDGRPTDLRLTPYPESEDHRGGVTVARDDEDDDESGRGKSGKRRRGKTGVKEEPKVLDPMVGVEELQVLCRGWGYQKPDRPTWNMTCSGLSSLLLVRENVVGVWKGDQWRKLNESIRDGYGWVLANFTPTATYYGIYSLEKVADIGGIKKFGSHDWYEEVSDHLVRRQQKAGNWPDGNSHGENPRVATSFALLVLNRATMLLTMNPASRVIFTGGGSREESNLSREWVYIEELDTCLHCPQILRTIRMRPNRKLVGFIEKLVEGYQPEFRHELVEDLLRVRKEVRSKSVRKIVSRCLESIVGRELESDEAYVAWVATVDRVIEIGDKQETAAVAELVRVYAAAVSVGLKRQIVRAAVRLGAKDLIPVLIEDLAHSDAEFRFTVYRAISNIVVSGVPEFDARGDAKERAAQIERIRAWWERESTGG